MPTFAQMSRAFCLFVGVLFLSLLCALPLVGCAAAPVEATNKVPRPEFKVLQGACDDRGGVTAIALAVAGPGIVVLQWDNAVECGAPS